VLEGDFNPKKYISNKFKDVPVNAIKIAGLIKKIDADNSLNEDASGYLTQEQFTQFKADYLKSKSERKEVHYIVLGEGEEAPEIFDKSRIILQNERVKIRLTPNQWDILEYLKRLYPRRASVRERIDSLNAASSKSDIGLVLGYSTTDLMSKKLTTFIRKVLCDKNRVAILDDARRSIEEFQQKYLGTIEEAEKEYQELMLYLMDVMFGSDKSLAESLQTNVLDNMRSIDNNYGSFFALGAYIEHEKKNTVSFYSSASTYFNNVFEPYKKTQNTLDWDLLERNYQDNWHNHFRLALIYKFYLLVEKYQEEVYRLQEKDYMLQLKSLTELESLGLTGISPLLIYEIVSVAQDLNVFSLLSETTNLNAKIKAKSSSNVTFINTVLKPLIDNELKCLIGGGW
jgi:hypothetical protein